MIQSYQNDPLLHNYLAPSYPLFIQLKSLIQGVATKKAGRNVKSDILFVLSSPCSSPQNSALKANASRSPRFSIRLRPASSRKSRRAASELACSPISYASTHLERHFSHTSQKSSLQLLRMFPSAASSSPIFSWRPSLPFHFKLPWRSHCIFPISENWAK